MTAGELNTGGFGTKKNIQKLKNLSLDTNDSSSSRFSVDSQKPRTRPPSGTYVIELPKEKIFRFPPPENAARYEYLSRRKRKQSNCRRCFWYSLAGLLLFLFLIAIVLGVLFLVYQPHKPRFSVSKVSITGMNLTSSSSPISPVITVKLRVENVNNKLGLIYERGNEVEVFYDGIKLGNGEFTAFKQAANNVAVVTTVFKGSSIQLTSSSRKRLIELEKKRVVPFGLGVIAPVQFKAGAVTTWTLTVKVECKMIVDKLTASATLVTETCETGLSMW